MTFYELYNKLSELYPKELSCNWDNDGIMCASNLNAEVNSILIALDVTMDTVDYAIDNGFDTIISHHPLVFHSQKSLTPLNYTQEKLIKLIQNNVKVMSFHTRLDAAKNGVNDTLAGIIGASRLEIDKNDPVGRIGELENEIALSTFAENIKKALNTPVVLFNGTRTVKKVYIVGGDGKDLIENAISYAADTILTGRASYNTIIDAKDMKLNIVEAGHFFTENPVCKVIESDVLSICPTIKTEIYNSNSIKTIWQKRANIRSFYCYM